MVLNGLPAIHVALPKGGLPFIQTGGDRVNTASDSFVKQLVADEVLNGPANATQDMLADFRPQRFK